MKTLQFVDLFPSGRWRLLGAEGVLKGLGLRACSQAPFPAASLTVISSVHQEPFPTLLLFSSPGAFHGPWPWCWERLKAGKKGMAEDEVVGWHHRLSRHEFEQALGVGDGQGGLVCCSPWGRKSWTWLSHWTELNWTDSLKLGVMLLWSS